MNIEIAGEGGKGGGGGGKEASDTLVSTQTVKALFVLGEGVIDSVENIYLDTIPISNFTASWVARTGLPSQTVIEGFINTEQAVGSFTTKVLKQNDAANPTRYSASIPYNVDAVRLTFTIPVMSSLDGSGNIGGSKAYFDLYIRKDTTSNWNIAQQNFGKSGKTTNGYTFDLVQDRPSGVTQATGNWEVSVMRVTPDSTSVKTQNSVSWTSLTYITYNASTYKDSALVAVTLSDASQFGSRIPEIMFKVKGRKVKIFSNYNTITRVYNGNWDGAFKLANEWTSNPALVLLDILTDVRAGVGLPLSDVDTNAIYALAVYSDDSISDGLGSTIPRYTFDYSIQQRDSVQTVLAQILSICNANLITNEFGQVSVIFQKPGQVVKRNVTNSNVIDGSFTYQSSNIEQRTNLVNVTYNNGLNYGRTDTATQSDDALITRYGLQPIDIALPGCYHEAQAIRKARWALYSNSYFTTFVSFSVFLDGMVYKIGDLIRVFDNYNQDSQQGGVVTAVNIVGSNTEIVFDRDISLTGTHTFYCYDTAGAEVSKTISLSSPISKISVSGSLNITLGTPFIFSGAISGKLYRITTITKNEEDSYAISALEFNEAIYTYIDTNVIITPKTGDFVDVTAFYTTPVTSISIQPYFSTNGTYSSGKLQVSWIWDAAKTQKYKATFKIQWSVDNGTITTVDNILTDNFDIVNPLPGIYYITVYAVAITGVVSKGYTQSFPFRVSSGLSTLKAPINVRVVGTNIVTPQPSTLNFATPDLNITFDYNPLNQNVAVVDALDTYIVEVCNPSTGLKLSSYTVKPSVGTATVDPIDGSLTYNPLNGEFSLPFSANRDLFGGTPSRNVLIKIYSKDTLGNLSDPIGITFTNPVPATIDISTVKIYSDVSSVRIDIPASSEFDAKEYLVWRGTTNSFTANDASLVYKGSGNSVTIATPDTTEYWYKVAVGDTFGSTSLNVSAAVSKAAVTLDATRFTYYGLVFSTDKANNVVSWTSFTAASSDGTSISVNAGSDTWLSGTLFIYYVPGVATLRTTTNAQLAVTGRILASYRGGSNLTNDSGRAYIDGDQIVTGSLLTTSFNTNVAYITSMAMVGDILQSTNYIAGTSGWRLPKSGIAEFTGIVIRSGNLDNNSTLAGNSVSSIVTSANSAATKTTTFYTTTQPTATTVGDLWYNTSTALIKRWSGTTWDDFGNNYTNTNQLVDGAGLGAAAVWTSVSGRPTSLASLDPTASTTLSTASTNATAANTAVTNMASDSIFDPVEKQRVLAEWNNITSEKVVYNTQASTYGIITENTTYNNAYQSLANYLNAGIAWSSGLPSWINTTNITSSTTIIGDTFRTTFKTYYDARVALDSKINSVIDTKAANAKTTADAAAAAAIKANTTTRGATAPITPKDGDLWFDTNVNKYKRYNSGTALWESTEYTPKNGYGTIASAPSTGNNINDTYFDSTTNLMYVWSTQAGVTTWRKVMPLMTSTNISNYIDSASIGNAQIGSLAVGSGNIQDLAVTTAKITNAAITTAKIGVAQVDTLTIAGNAVTVPLSVINTTAITVINGSTAITSTLTTLTTGILSTTEDLKAMVNFGCFVNYATGSIQAGSMKVTFKLYKNDGAGDVEIYSGAWLDWSGQFSAEAKTCSSCINTLILANKSAILTFKALITARSNSSITYNNSFINVISVKR